MHISNKHPAINIIYQNIEALRPDPGNPRIHSKKQIKQIAQSIEVFGFNVPVLVDGKLNIIAGHGRILAATELGLAEVPTICLEHLSATQIKAFMIADNRLTENSSWDDKLLGEQFKMLSDMELDFSLDITGFTIGEIDLKITGLDSPIAKDDPDDIIPEPQAVVSKLGDLWILGKHRIYCGSALEEESFHLLMEGKLASMVFIDPPYNVAVNGHVCGLGSIKHREFAMASGEMDKSGFTDFLTKACSLLAKHSVDGSIHYICMDWRHMAELLEAGQTAYTELKNLCVWAKDNAGMGSFYRSQHELVFVFKNGKAQHRNNFELGQYGRYRSNVWNYPGANSFSARKSDEGNLLEMHPTVKPVAMVADAILDCSARGEIILDTFLGSGTTLLAAERTGRICRGIELDHLYIDTAIRRWQNFTGEIARHAVTSRAFNEIMEPANV